MYLIAKQSKPHTSGTWYVEDDHTYPGDPNKGYLLQVNAGAEVGQFYQYQIDNLCGGSKLYFSAWITSVVFNNPSVRDKTNQIFVLEDTRGNVLARYYTGDIPDDNTAWKAYGFEFLMPQGESSVILKIINNGTGTSGNDFVMDDIEIRICLPQVVNTPSGDFAVCKGSTQVLKGHYTDDGTFGSPLSYRWEYSTTGDVSTPSAWSIIPGTEGSVPLTTVSDSDTEYELADMNISETGYYRLVVSSPGNINNYNCRAMSDPIHLMVYDTTSISTRIDGQTAICTGSSTTLTAVNSGISSPAFNWYDSPSGDPISTSNPYTTPLLTAGTKTYYVSGANFCQNMIYGQKTPVTITVGNPITPSVTISTPGTTVCPNTSVTLTASPVGGGSNPSYQWKKNNINAGTNSPTYTLTPINNDAITCEVTSSLACASPATATSNTLTFTINSPTVNTLENKTYDAGEDSEEIIFTSTPSGATYTWTNSNTAIGLTASGSGNLPVFTAANTTSSAISATITVTPSYNGCTGASRTFTITVNPPGNVDPLIDQTYCAGETTTPITFTSTISGTTFRWTNSDPRIGLSASGNGNIASFTAANPTNAPIVATITVTPYAPCRPGRPCWPFPGPSSTFTITVNPSPTVNSVTNKTHCNTDPTTAITLSSPVSGATITWTNSDTSIGLDASGTGNLPAFVATNTSSSPVTATISATATANSCTGSARTFTIRVNPTPTVNPVDDKTYCNTAATGPITFSSPVSGTTYAWTNSNVAIGLADHGTGNIAGFTANNTTSSLSTATITVTPTANSCVGSEYSFTITVNPLILVNNILADKTYTSGESSDLIIFASSVAGATFDWTNDRTSIGLTASGTGNIMPFITNNMTATPVTATIRVTASAFGCTGPGRTFTITVDPFSTVNPVNDTTYCTGVTVAPIPFTSPVSGTTFAWTNTNTSIGLDASGSGSLPSFTTTNTTTSPQTATITVIPTANNQPGDPMSFTITVNPVSTINDLENKTCANGAASGAITFSSPVAGTTYTWTNTNTSIGLAASGSGNIASFTATNTGTAPVTALVTVTSTANSCPGTSRTFTITVNPTSSVNPIASVVYCNGASASAISFSSPVAGTTYTWTNDKPAIGLAASGSSSNIAGFTATNTTSSPLIATIKVTPTANGNTGVPTTFTITVNPTPTVNTIDSRTYCNGAPADEVSFSSPVSGTTYAWTNDTPAIGLAGGGSGDITPFTATNTTAAPVTATITVTPTANSCTGTARTLTIRVNPTATVDNMDNKLYCHGESSGAISFSSPVSGTTFAWTNSSTYIGLSASGSGAISSFTANNTRTYPVTAAITVTPTANSCAGTFRTFTITVNPLSAGATQIAVDGATSLCHGDATTLTATAAGVINPIYKWYGSQSGNDLLQAGPAYTTPALTAPTAITTYTYYVTVTGENYCEGAPNTTGRKAVTITDYPLAPGASMITVSGTTTICSGQTTQLTASAPGVTDPVYRWYPTPTSTQLLHTGATYTSPSLTSSASITTYTYYVSVSGSNYCEGPADATGRRAVTISVKAISSPANLTISGAREICSDHTTTLTAGSSTVTNPVYRWYRTAEGATQYHTGSSYTSSLLTADTTWYVTVSGDNYCEGAIRDTVDITITCFTLRGTVFPLVHVRASIDRLFPVTAALYAVPRSTVRDPIGVIRRSTPLYTGQATYYDGSTYIAGTPKYPGRQGRTDNPGLPIDWSRIHKTPGPVNDTPVTPGEIPTAPVGLYTLYDVQPGDYVLMVSRAGYIPRFAKITVSGNTLLGHRELIGGDVDQSLFIGGEDISLINKYNGNAQGDEKYDPAYDTNGNAEIEDADISLVKYYQGFDHEGYLDTMQWLSIYYGN
jgi:hypothetical protein